MGFGVFFEVTIFLEVTTGIEVERVDFISGKLVLLYMEELMKHHFLDCGQIL